jgi:hypothetical protein
MIEADSFMRRRARPFARPQSGELRQVLFLTETLSCAFPVITQTGLDWPIVKSPKCHLTQTRQTDIVGSGIWLAGTECNSIN